MPNKYICTTIFIFISNASYSKFKYVLLYHFHFYYVIILEGMGALGGGMLGQWPVLLVPSKKALLFLEFVALSSGFSFLGFAD